MESGKLKRYFDSGKNMFRDDGFADSDRILTLSYERGGLGCIPTSGSCPDLCKKVGNVSRENFEEAVDTIMVWMAKNQYYRIDVDIDDRNEMAKPVKEMTIKEIEERLGHKIKIVDDKED